MCVCGGVCVWDVGGVGRGGDSGSEGRGFVEKKSWCWKFRVWTARIGHGWQPCHDGSHGWPWMAMDDYDLAMDGDDYDLAMDGDDYGMAMV